jgi:succinate dehydrogenase / fumarate reductase cytochrome b subunit
MWLTSSSVGRKFIMALTGACLVLFVTFHCVMNAVAIAWPTAYNAICEFLGANWYALIASAGLALLFIIHIIYAIMLTLQNRKARGNVRYEVSKNAPGVEWSSKNMLVLGIVVLAFFVVHLIQFWAKMQLAEIAGCEGAIPASAGTLFIQEAFSCPWTPVIYIIGFVALWFHFNHGFWSMFQSIGWDNTTWIPRLKKISCWWTSLVVACFIIQAAVFTFRANSNYYKEDPALVEQYMDMLVSKYNLPEQIKQMPLDMLAEQAHGQLEQMKSIPEEQKEMYRRQSPDFDKQFNEQYEMIEHLDAFCHYLKGTECGAPALPQGPQGPQGPAPEQPEMDQPAPQAPEAQVAPEAEAPQEDATTETETTPNN